MSHRFVSYTKCRFCCLLLCVKDFFLTLWILIWFEWNLFKNFPLFWFCFVVFIMCRSGIVLMAFLVISIQNHTDTVLWENYLKISWKQWKELFSRDELWEKSYVLKLNSWKNLLKVSKNIFDDFDRLIRKHGDEEDFS